MKIIFKHKTLLDDDTAINLLTKAHNDWYVNFRELPPHNYGVEYTLNIVGEEYVYRVDLKKNFRSLTFTLTEVGQ